MKKILCVLLVLVLALGVFAGCGGSKTDDTKEVVMITDVGDIDDQSFNQGTWEGVVAWAKANNKTYDYIKPNSSDTPDLVSAMDLAVKNGAKVIVTPGFVFATAVDTASKAYPDVKFVLIDTAANEDRANIAAFTYNAEYSGFLAGYAAVKEGMTNLAYLGGIGYPSVNNFGFGFLQGAELAAVEMGVAEVKMAYGYTGNFDETADNKTKATGLFNQGVECIFSVGGKNQKSCFAAAAEAGAGKWVISPDTDSTGLSEKCLTSALKQLGKTAQTALDDVYTNNSAKYFGKSSVLSIDQGMVGIADATWRFTKFSKDEYKAVYDKLVNGTITVKCDPVYGDEAEKGFVASLGLTKVKVEYIDTVLFS